MARPMLTVLPARSETVTLPRYRVVEAAMDAKALTDDLERALEAIAQRMWSGNRAAAVNEIGRAHLRIAEMRGAFLELAGLGETTPSDPSNAARAVA
jgi:hypothetical protein